MLKSKCYKERAVTTHVVAVLPFSSSKKSDEIICMQPKPSCTPSHHPNMGEMFDHNNLCKKTDEPFYSPHHHEDRTNTSTEAFS